MSKYTFLTVQTEEVMEVPGEIIQTYTNRPFNSEQYVALVELDEEATEDNREDTPDVPSEFTSDSEGVSEPTPVDYGKVDGVGPATAKNLGEAGYKTHSDVLSATTDGLEEVNGVGPSTAENIKQYVE